MISVVIPTRNRADLLHDCLVSVGRQTLPGSLFEVLVIDNGSEDHTPDVIVRVSKKLQNLRSFKETRPGLHAGRHRGLKESRGEVLVFADDDIEATPGWLEAIANTFEDPATAMAGGNNLPRFMEPPPSWLTRLWETSNSDDTRVLETLSILELQGEARPIDPYLVFGCNFSIRKDVLVAAGGFHPDAMPADLIRFRGDGESHVSRYVTETGLKCMFHPGATVHHKVSPERMTVDYFHKRGFRKGMSDSFTQLRSRGARPGTGYGNPLRKALRVARRRVRPFCTWDAEIRKALCAAEAGYRRGLAFHRKAYLDDAEVRGWVHRPDFLDV